MATEKKVQKVIVVGAGPVGTLAALYAAQRGHHVEVYELRGGKSHPVSCFIRWRDFSTTWSNRRVFELYWIIGHSVLCLFEVSTTSLQRAEDFQGKCKPQVTRHRFSDSISPPLHILSSDNSIENFSFPVHLTVNIIYLLPFYNI